MTEIWKVASELRQRTGHRFNIIIKSLPENSDSAITYNELLRRVEAGGYLGGKNELAENLDALERRKEIGVISGSEGIKRYWATKRGKRENRKRVALIMLHTVELTEDEIIALEKMAQTKRQPLVSQEC